MLRDLCPELRQRDLAERRQTLLRIENSVTGELLDRGLVTYFAAPRSYTGEDSAEISTHGGVIAPQLVLSALVELGVRQALPGEFTHRALLNGKLDLVQAEAVLDLTDGRSPALHRAAIHQIEGGLSARVQLLRERIIRAEALVGYSIDFPEEDEPPVSRLTVRTAVLEVLEQIDLLLQTAPEGELLRRGALVVLAGPPNSGKSSLLNSLLGVDRAIVTDIPGTTRDAVEADLTLDGFPFRIVDTAGLRQTPDKVEAIGIEVAQRYLASADIVLFCVEAGAQLVPDQRQFLDGLADAEVVLVRTKADLLAVADDSKSHLEQERRSTGRREILISTQDGRGLARLKRSLVVTAFSGLVRTPADSPLVTSRRQAGSLERAKNDVKAFLDDWNAGVSDELAVTHLQAADGSLEELIGVVSADDILGAIFSDFCVGK